ncbi:hypothetical protein SteCoe_13740 [Stentor coeruleus]|uniref:Uncharacterized protein n=1 Tax=Stentor coeruleus TaxID=5963 RepID=A0A1R2C7P8_9CILI|nr:hypothetical protein SteCoe_13740 [Stentor coeruleus]
MAFDLKPQDQLQMIKRGGFGALILLIILSMIAIEWSTRAWVIAIIPMALLAILIIFGAHKYFEAEQGRINDKSKDFILFCVYNSVLSLGLFFTLMSINLHKIIDVGWGYVFIPLWYFFGIYAAVAVYVIPYLKMKGDDGKRKSLMIVLWLASMILASIFHVLWIETSFPSELCIVLSPVLIVGFVGIVAERVARAKAAKIPGADKPPILTFEFIWAALVFSTVMITLLIYMVIPIPNVVSFLPILKIAIIMMVMEEKLYTKFKKEGYQYIEN